MRPRLVEERQLLEKIRAHADELVNPKTPATPEPVISPSASRIECEKDRVISWEKSEFFFVIFKKIPGIRPF